jgi:anti-anti-sigma regulatory factor
VLTVSGVVDDTETPELQTQLLDVLEHADGDIVMDACHVEAIGDPALVALTAARSRAKHLRHRVVVVDRPDGAMTAALRRTGLLFRFPVFAELADADEGLQADKTARRRLTLSA